MLSSSLGCQSMPAPRPWTVNHPQPLTRRDEGLWTIDDEVPGMPGAGRRMTVVKRPNGALLFYNAIPVPDGTLEQIRALGRPEQLIVPNQFHALDAAAFAQKLELTAYAPAVAVPKLTARLTCQPISALPLDPSLRHFAVEGFTTQEAVVLTGGTLLVADLITNVPHGRGITGLLMRAVGFTGPAPKLPKPVRKRVGRDLVAVGALMHQLAALAELKRIIPSHGEVIEDGGPAALRAVAQTLS
jgi:hypothetical protein